MVTARDIVPAEVSKNYGEKKQKPPKCTMQQFEIIYKQLPPEDCQANIRIPWSQRCSFSYATQCPDASWIEGHYEQLHHRRHQEEQHSESKIPFTGIFVGCNDRAILGLTSRHGEMP